MTSLYFVINILRAHGKHFPKSCSLKHECYEMLAAIILKKGVPWSNTFVIIARYSCAQLSTLGFLVRESCIPANHRVRHSAFCRRDRCPLPYSLWAQRVACFGQWNMNFQAEVLRCLGSFHQPSCCHISYKNSMF